MRGVLVVFFVCLMAALATATEDRAVLQRNAEEDVARVYSAAGFSVRRSSADDFTHLELTRGGGARADPSSRWPSKAAAPRAHVVGGAHDFDWVPSLVGNALINGAPLSWAGKCFAKNTAMLERLSPTSLQLTVTVSGWAGDCLGDVYVFGDAEALYVRWYMFAGTHTLTLNNVPYEEVRDIEQNGLALFLFEAGAWDTVVDIAEFALLFFDSPWTQADALSFLRDRMNITYAPRSDGFIALDKSRIKSGTYLTTQRFDASEIIIQYGTGSWVGHTTVAIWRTDGQLYVCESTGKNSPNYWPPPYGVVCHLWDEWMQLADAANYAVTVLPLRPDLQAKFNATAANEFLDSRLGMPYGFANFVYGWIDTPEDNLPPPLTGEFLAALLAMASRLAGDEVNMMFIWGLNHRLGTQCNDSACIFDALAQRNLNLTEAMSIPEQDAWVYPDGSQMVCDVFLLEVLKASGIFEPVVFQATEFTPKDLYTLDIWDPNGKSAIQCPTKADADPRWCQVLGSTKMAMPGWNSIAPYSAMCERCPSKYPEYERPAGC